jgi:hypothetical protein
MVKAGPTVTRFVMLARAVLKLTPEMRRIPALYVPLVCGNIQSTVAYVFDGVANEDLVANVVDPAVDTDSELDIIAVNEWLLPVRFSPETGEHDEGD